jgi:hypothetical protein
MERLRRDCTVGACENAWRASCDVDDWGAAVRYTVRTAAEVPCTVLYDGRTIGSNRTQGIVDRPLALCQGKTASAPLDLSGQHEE